MGMPFFSNTGVKILFGGSGNGEGIAINNQSKAETFMKMFEVQAGLGMGVKKFKVVFIVDNQKASDGFVNSGWEFGQQPKPVRKREEPCRVQHRSPTESGCIK
jgi:hypothetical protein